MHSSWPVWDSQPGAGSHCQDQEVQRQGPTYPWSPQSRCAIHRLWAHQSHTCLQEICLWSPEKNDTNLKIYISSAMSINANRHYFKKLHVFHQCMSLVSGQNCYCKNFVLTLSNFSCILSKALISENQSMWTCSPFNLLSYKVICSFLSPVLTK